MKTLLICLIIACCYQSYAQDQTDIQKLLKQYKVSPKNSTDSLHLFRKHSDSAWESEKKNFQKQIHNPLSSFTLKGKKVGDNGNGQDIYVLPLDNMPSIRPDSTYSSRMPVAGGTLLLRKP